LNAEPEEDQMHPVVVRSMHRDRFILKPNVTDATLDEVADNIMTLFPREHDAPQG
jgi:hypothetical protein